MDYVIPNNQNYGCDVYSDSDLYENGKSSVPGCGGGFVEYALMPDPSESKLPAEYRREPSRLSYAGTVFSAFGTALGYYYARRYIESLYVVMNSQKMVQGLRIHTYKFGSGKQSAPRDVPLTHLVSRSSRAPRSNSSWFFRVKGDTTSYLIEPKELMYDRDMCAALTQGPRYIDALCWNRKQMEASTKRFRR